MKNSEFLDSWFLGWVTVQTDLETLKREVVRKILHFLIALSPGMAAVNRPLTVLLLITGVILYACMERFRLVGIRVPLISQLTSMASRARDEGHFVLGPVTLGLGALLALLFYPAPAAVIAIYALAFGDGCASLIGKSFGVTRPAFLLGKSVEGSLACFCAVFLSAFHVSPDYRTALFAAIVATLVEALPLKDYDNIALPVTVGFVVQALSGVSL
ncbi:MAG: SEC59/DGK1/VTE5 family protein [Spirochaetaceae bacterium]|jgi:dolichol kinase|nr:SEC59/DGK1/VTE5 family protein [Spirochaetaceae bacterium]